MSTSRNNLRILWIPGRKKHNRKGQYDSTNKHVDYSSQQKKSGQWSLGGNRNQEKLITSNLNGLTDVATVSGVVPVSCAIGAGAIHHNLDKPEFTKTIDEKSDEINLTDSQDTTDCILENDTETIKKEKKKKNDTKSGDSDDTIVKYIYYSLMCCECSIS